MDEVRIKKGSCRFGSDRLMIDESLKNYFFNFMDMWKQGFLKHKIIFSAAVFTLFFSLSFSFNVMLGATPTQLVFFITALMVVLLVSKGHSLVHGFTREKVIEWGQIHEVKFNPGMKWVTCPRFIVRYVEDGEERKRYVIMPTHLIPGVDEDIESIKENFEDRDVEVDW